MTHQEMTISPRRLTLAYAWGKWLSNSDEIRKLMDACRKLRVVDGDAKGDGNWGIMVHTDPWALQYQRLEFRLRRAQRAVGSWGMTMSAIFDPDGPDWIKLMGVEFPVHIMSAEQLKAENFQSFDRNHRQRAVRAKQAVEDKRPPALVVDERLCADDWDEQKRSMGGYY